MGDIEIQTILKDLNDNPSTSTIERVFSSIGRSKSINELLFSHMKDNNITSSIYLPICQLLILEKTKGILEIVKNILRVNPEQAHNFLSELLKSKFYIHRRCVPILLPETQIDNKRFFLKQCFNDNISVVVFETALSLHKYSEIPLSVDELLEIAMDLNNHHSDFVQCCVPEILVYINQNSHLVADICMSNSYRKRLALAQKVRHLSPENIKHVYDMLSRDNESIIRLALAENIDCVSECDPYVEIFLKDECEKVRSTTVKKISNLPKYYDKLESLVSDSSWDVKINLLQIKNDSVYENISVPIMNSVPKDLNWRLRKEILGTVFHVSVGSDTFIREFLLDQIFKNIVDPAFRVRELAGFVISGLINKYDWSIKWKDRILQVVNSKNYLIRISSASICYAYDKKFNSDLLKLLLKDKILNVRGKALEYLTKEDITEDIISIIKGYGDEVDEKINEEIIRLGLDK